MTALFSLFNRAEIFAKDMGMNDDVDMWIFAFFTVIGSLITVKGGRIFRSSSTSRTVSLEIEGDYGSLEFNALVDSGNLATEPISGKSVVFVSIEKSKIIIGETMYNAIKNSSDMNNISIELLSKIRIIPTHAVSGKRLLPALKLKNVRITQGRRKKDIDVYIAFVDDEFLPGYDAIISEEAII